MRQPRQMFLHAGANAILLVGLLIFIVTHGFANDDSVQFNRDIRSILSDNCFQCHGPDASQRKAGLRLDTEKGAFQNKDGVRPFVSGRPDESEVYRRITTDDPDSVMPPAESGRILTGSEKTLIRR